MSESTNTYICPICLVASDDVKAERCVCGYPRKLHSGPIEPHSAAPYLQLWVASARHKASGSLIAGWLVQITGYEKKVFDLYIGTNEIGRPSEYAHPDILISGDPMVSREHAVIECAVDEARQVRAQLIDKSTNGTFIDDSSESITQHLLHDGVKISMGDSALVFKSVYMAISHLDALEQTTNASRYFY